MRFRTGFLIKTVLMCLLLTSCSVQEDPIDSLFERIHQANNAFSEESEALNSQTAQNSEDEPLHGVWISYLELSKLAGSAESVFHAQAAAMIYRCAQAQGKGFTGAWMFHLPFTDVPEWAYESVAWCYMNSVTTGVSETSFAPGNDCTRAQIVTFLWRAFGK